jgi:glyoxalase-like protein
VTDGAPRVRLRQAVLVAAELEPVADQLREALGLGEPFRDPGVAMFGLENAVFALGDCFLEIVSPTAPGTAAGRYLERQGGDGGYMVMFDLEDLAAGRQRAKDSGVRTVWEIDLPDISGTHLHPADIGGAIVSIDGSAPYGSWRWGGPDWTGQIGTGGAPGRLAGVTLAVAEPAAAAARWARVLGVQVSNDGAVRGASVLALKDAEVCFVDALEVRAEGLTEITLADVPALEREVNGVETGRVRFRQEPSG